MMTKKILLLLIILSKLQATDVFIKDAENFYTKRTAKILFTAFIPAAVIANSSIDIKLHNFYQDNIRSKGTDDAAKIFKALGSNKPLSIAFFSGTFAGYIFKNTPPGKGLYDLCISSLRGITVGMPLLIAGQNLLGADRPNQNTDSYYKPFANDHGVSGHAFMGAVPFITAANMTNQPVVKGLLYGASTLTGLSRINDSAHYTSQVILGWTLAYASCLATNDSNLQLVMTPNKVAIGGVF